MCTVLTQDAIVSNWLNTGQNATTGSSTVDFTTSATSRVITINSVDYPIYPSTAASAISITSGTIIFEGKPTTGTVTASIYTYRIAGQATKARLRKIAGFVGVVSGDADGEVVAGFRKMDRGQGWQLGASPAGGKSFWFRAIGENAPSFSGLANYAFISGQLEGSNKGAAEMVRAVYNGSAGIPREGKTNDPRTSGQYFYTWAGIYTP
jgi:hypothetical protein